MKILEVVTPPSIYHVSPNQKTFWEGKFTLSEFTPVNMKSFGRLYVRKHREIKDSDKYITLDIPLKFGSLYNMRITLPDPKYNLGRSGKELITYLGLRTNVRSKKCKNPRYTITNFSMKDLSKTIKEFEKITYKGYVRNRSKHETTDSYFYLARHISKCMVRVDVLNLDIDPVRTEMTGTQ